MDVHLLNGAKNETPTSTKSARQRPNGWKARKSDDTELRGVKFTRGVSPTPELTTYGGIKLGWIQGVLIPCLLNIWGVMLFLRIAWIVAQAGVGLTLVIIGLSAVLCVITTLSLCAICTNGELQGEANWGSSREAQRYQNTVTSLLQMARQAECVKTYSPQVLVLAGPPYARPALVYMAHLITNMGSFMIVADVNEQPMKSKERTYRYHVGDQWLQTMKFRGFYTVLEGMYMETGARVLMETSGLGRLKPNILLIGYKESWNVAHIYEITSYFRILQEAFSHDLAVTILRSPSSPAGRRIAVAGPARDTRDEAVSRRVLDIMSADSEADLVERELQEKGVDKNTINEGFLKASSSKLNEPLKFKEDGLLDAWWLYDDGGLNILLPYIVAQRGLKYKMRLRIFAVTKTLDDTDDVEKSMEQLLGKFRIDYDRLTVVRGFQQPASDHSWDLFNALVKPYSTQERGNLITDSELQKLHVKTGRYLRLRELLMEHSTEAQLVVTTLPLPREGLSPALYMSWLEVLSRGLPNTLFVRGSETVLTFRA